MTPRHRRDRGCEHQVPLYLPAAVVSHPSYPPLPAGESLSSFQPSCTYRSPGAGAPAAALQQEE